MDTTRLTVGLADGRDIDVLTAGPEDGLPIVFHEGTPIGLELHEPMVQACAVRGLRVILTARPGYEGSTPRPGRKVADVAGDVAAVLDQLGADTFLSIGWSGGGPHSLACAALLPGRCLAAASVAGVAPYHAEGLDFLAGMGPENVDEFTAATKGEGPLTEFLVVAAADIRGITGAQVAGALGGLVDAPDKAALTGEYAEHLAAALNAAIRSGVAGWRDDDLAFASDWGFDFKDLAAAGAKTAPVAIWQGDMDRMVPYAHGQWLAANIPGARVHLMPGEGHLSVTEKARGQILDDLLDLAGLTA
jgi:pimeloyl-ACP methyl ester carboxylesterase